MSASVYTLQGQQLLLTTEIGRGGEGTIYASPLNKLECAKIYGKPLSPQNYRKLELMVADPPRDPAYDARKHRSIAWPISLLYRDPKHSECVGFLMPTIDIRAFRKAILYLDPSDRTRLFGGSFSWKYLYTAAFNLVSSIAAIHEKSYCVGDINESNVLIAPNALITLIDCDSFQVPDPATGTVYRCPVGKAEYTAPELQGKSYAAVDRTRETDCFALAVLLFQLLMEGTHPYQAKGKLVEDAPSTQAKIIKGYFPYTMRRRGIAPPDHAPPFEILHPEIQQLFHRSFAEGHRDPRARPTAFEWFEVLKMLGAAFKQCSVNPNHLFLNHLGSCPWCQIRTTQGKDLFPSPVGQQISLDDPSVALDSLDKRIDYLRTYVMMALADGVLTPEEESYLVALGSKLQVPPKEIEKTIQTEAKKVKARLTSSGGGTPNLEISKSEFQFQNLRAGTTAQGTFLISNAGGGILQGSIKSDRPWLKLLHGQIDTTRHRQEVSFQIDTAGLSLGLKERGHIEVRSNGGTQIVVADLSIEIPDVALGRFRRGLFWLGFLGGGLFGYLLYQLLPATPSRDVVSGLAGFLGIVAAIVVGSRAGGFAGGCGGFILGSAILGTLQKVWPEAFSTLSWAITYGTFLHATSRPLFVDKQTGNKSATPAVAFGAIFLSAAIVLGGLYIGNQVDIQESAASTVGLPPVQTGVVATCAEAKGWKNYTPKTEFRPGDSVCVYAEALNVNRGGGIDVQFSSQMIGPNGNSVATSNERCAAQTQHSSCSLDGGSLKLPADALAGRYMVQVNMRNNLTGQTGQALTNFTVLPVDLPPSTNLAGLWQGAYSNGQSEVPFDAEIQQNGPQLTGRVKERLTYSPDLLSEIVGSINGNNVRFEKKYLNTSSALVAYIGQVAPDGMGMSGTWSAGPTSGAWRMQKQAASEAKPEPTSALRPSPETTIFDVMQGASIGNAHGIQWINALGQHGAAFSSRASSRIEYPTGIPSEGTLEFWIKIDNGYQYNNYRFLPNQDSAMIFSTDVQGGDVTWPGTTKLSVTRNGDITFWMATSKYNQPASPALEANGTAFRFGEWHAIGVSYGSEGQYIMLDGQIVASSPDWRQTLGRAGNHQMPLDIPSIGQTVSHFWPTGQYGGGFEGIVAVFRASSKQRDWFLARGIGD